MAQAIDLLIRAIPVLIGGGLVQLLIHLLKRRAETRSLDSASQRAEAESGQFVVTSAKASLELSDMVRDAAVKRADRLELQSAADRQRIRELEARLEQVEAALLDVSSLRAEVAELRAENAELRAERDSLRHS